MTFEEVIKNNCENISPVEWWPRYAFHYTDVTNAVNIMKEGVLYSRYSVSSMDLMRSDNASRQVIDMTCSGAVSNVRFYFRPLTPTQYHNEGFKHSNLRYSNDTNANVPVPIFFMFDLESILQMPETRFSEKSLAGYGDDLQCGEEAFSKLDFHQIYKYGAMSDPELEKKYRHAEIVYPDAFEIPQALKYIVCRNDIEKTTLLNLLRKEGTKLFSQYKDKVLIWGECFENNGLFIADCRYFEDKAILVFSNTYNKKRYTSKYKVNDKKMEMKASVEFDWEKSGNLLKRQNCQFSIDYEKTETVNFHGLLKPREAKVLYMRVFFESKLVCYMGWQLSDYAML